MPHYTGWLGRSSSQSAPTTDKAIYPRSSSSIVRYKPQIMRRGNQEAVFHYQKPPLHPLVYCGATAIGVIVCLWVGTAIWNWGSHVQEDVQYGLPRTYQIDALVGHNDSKDHPSHFEFQNLHGHVIIIEISGGDPAHSHIYVGPTLGGDNADLSPVIGKFDDETGRGTIDMVVLVGGQRIVFLNDGSTFHEQQ